MFRFMFIVLCLLAGSVQAEGIPEYNPATHYLSCYVENLGASETIRYKVHELRVPESKSAADVMSARRVWVATDPHESSWWDTVATNDPAFIRQKTISTATLMRNGTVPTDCSPNHWVSSANALELIAVSNRFGAIDSSGSAVETSIGTEGRQLCHALLLSIALMPNETTGVPTNPAVRRLLQGFGFEMRLLPITQKEWDLFNREYGWARKQ